MRNLVLVSAVLFVSVGCASTNPRLDYINQNLNSVNTYVKNSEQLGKLSSLIIQECYFKVLEKREKYGGLSFVDFGRLALQGLVTYEMDSEGTVIGAFYESKDRSKAKRLCVEKIALGYQLEPSNGLQFVYSEFELKYE